jgi:two-component system, NarL family, nitrate/nitrite response regulator NarL
LVVTAGMSDQEAVQLVQAGISGILHKHHSTDVLCDTIRRVAGGEVCLEPIYLSPLFRAMDRTRTPKRATLTDRDKTILRCILQGLTNREIATRIEISEGAVKASVRHVCEKLGVRTRSQLVKVALEQYKDQL